MKACITALGISVLILFAIIPSAHAIDAAIWEKLTYTKKLFYDGYIDGMLKREPKTPEQLGDTIR